MCRGVCLLGFSSKQSNSKQLVVVAETEQAIRRRSGSKRAICCSASKQAIRCLTDERAISCSIDEQASKWASNPSFWKGAGKGGAQAGRQAGGKEEEGEGKEAGGWGIYLCCVNRALFCREKRKKERNRSKGMSAAISEVPRRRGRRDWKLLQETVIRGYGSRRGRSGNPYPHFRKKTASIMRASSAFRRTLYLLVVCVLSRALPPRGRRIRR
jgi:hypothetical protein